MLKSPKSRTDSDKIGNKISTFGCLKTFTVKFEFYKQLVLRHLKRFLKGSYQIINTKMLKTFSGF